MVEIRGETCTIYSCSDGVIILGKSNIVALISDEWIENLESIGGDGLNHYYVTPDGRIVVYTFNDYDPNQLAIYDSWRDMVKDFEESQYLMATGGNRESGVKPDANILEWLDDLKHGRLGQWEYNKYSCKYEYVRGKEVPELQAIITNAI